jgi:murein DD-endopeptidase MepM/ murein hydrolase activator NlpD
VALAIGVVGSLVPEGPGAPRAAAQAGGPDEGGRVEYSPPVDAPVTDPFRPPPEPWLPGNRGIEFGTAPGTPVRAAGRGRVTFAGPVAGALHVTITHPDGIRTSYSFLAALAVGAGTEVARGHVLGTTGARLHVGARRGTTYIDPASLWGATGPPWVRLAPLDGGGAGRGGSGGLGGGASAGWHAGRAPPTRRVGGVRGVAT